jgi:hypothetical protein
LARAKQTGRSEARRNYRQSMAPPEADGEGEPLEPGADAEVEREGRRAKAAPARPADDRPPSGRVGFGASLRLAYHPPNIREDIRTLPTTLRSRGFIAAVLLVIGGGLAWYAYPYYSGSLQAWDLIVQPGTALAPQLVAGFFAPRASYLLGLIVGLVQPIVFLLVTFSPRVQEAFLARGGTISDASADQLALLFFNSVLMGALFAAMAAWYRRFLALSSRRTSNAARAAAASRTSGRPPTKPSSRRTANR